MDNTRSQSISVPDNVIEPLFIASGFSTLTRALEHLIGIAKSTNGRLDLASKNVLLPVLQLCKAPLQLSGHDLLLSIKLLRNLCAGEIKNQNLFIELNGDEVLSRIFNSMGLASGHDNWLLHMLLQTLGNVSLAGEQCQFAVWHHFFPVIFPDIAKIRSKETCDTLCMIIYTCSEGTNEIFAELLTDSGLDLIVQIIRTVAAVGFSENWVKLLLSRICIEESKFWSVFSKLSPVMESGIISDIVCQTNQFGAEQVFLLSLLSEILNDQIGEIVVSSELSLCIFSLLKIAVENGDFTSRGKSSLPTGVANTDVMGYALTILRDISACDHPKISNPYEKRDAVDMLVSAGLIKFLISLLHDLELPETIRKANNFSDVNGVKTSKPSKYCPYIGFRRDVVAIVGNCSYQRKHVQDELRKQEGIFIMLQQCVTDEDNPFLREWGIWSLRNILEGNVENKKLVADLEVQGSVNTPEVTELGLRVEVDPKTRQPKLVNTS